MADTDAHRPPTAVEAEAGIEALVQAAVAWLGRPQPADCHMHHHGPNVGTTGPTDDDLLLSISPRGFRRNLPVLVVDRVGPRRPSPLEDIENPLTSEEMDLVRQAITAAGSTIADEWNGPPNITASFALTTTVHPDLLAAVDRYHAGCPNHPSKTVFCDCKAWRAEFRRAALPAVAVPTKGDGHG